MIYGAVLSILHPLPKPLKRPKLPQMKVRIFDSDSKPA